MKKNIEIKIYELLGIKIFRKCAYALYKMARFPRTIFMTQQARKSYYSKPDNYNMKKGNGLQDLRDFKEAIFINTFIHIYCLFSCIPNFLNVLNKTAPISGVITNLTAILINIYCIMLQRYNYIRINKVLKKGESKEQRQKMRICEELKQEKKLFNDFTYKIVNKKNKGNVITIDEFLQIATLQQLKDYRKALKNYNQQIECKMNSSIEIPLEKGKFLKLELNQNQNINLNT